MRYSLSLILIICFNCPAEDLSKFAYRIKYERTEDGHVYTGHGKGIGVDLTKFNMPGDKFIMTAWHVVATSTTLYAEIDGDWLRCAVVKHDEDFDIAIIEVKFAVPNRVEISEVEPDIGSKLVCLCAPEEEKPKEIKGQLIAKHEPTLANPLLWQMSISHFNHGSSGSGVLLDGKLCGIAVGMIKLEKTQKDGTVVSEQIKDVALFLPLKRIKQFLRD